MVSAGGGGVCVCVCVCLCQSHKACARVSMRAVAIRNLRLHLQMTIIPAGLHAVCRLLLAPAQTLKLSSVSASSEILSIARYQTTDPQTRHQPTACSLSMVKAFMLGLRKVSPSSESSPPVGMSRYQRVRTSTCCMGVWVWLMTSLCLIACIGWCDEWASRRFRGLCVFLVWVILDFCD